MPVDARHQLARDNLKIALEKGNEEIHVVEKAAYPDQKKEENRQNGCRKWPATFRGRLSNDTDDGAPDDGATDEVSPQEGTELTYELLTQALPLESFVSVLAEEAL